jgi:DNA polymerase III epsilon subunit-like protein
MLKDLRRIIFNDKGLRSGWIRKLPSRPRETTAIHHITNADVAHAPPFRQMAAAILEILADCNLGRFGVVRFDIPMLVEEFARSGFEHNPDNRSIVDAQRIYHKKEPRDLSAALTFYCGARKGPPCQTISRDRHLLSSALPPDSPTIRLLRPTSFLTDELNLS